MPHSKHPVQLIAAAYAVIVLLAAFWALVVDVTLLNSGREHLLPDIILASITMPLSLAIGSLYAAWPEVFGSEFVQVASATTCGLVQAWALYTVGAFFARSKHAA